MDDKLLTKSSKQRDTHFEYPQQSAQFKSCPALPSYSIEELKVKWLAQDRTAKFGILALDPLIQNLMKYSASHYCLFSHKNLTNTDKTAVYKTQGFFSEIF